MANIDVPGLDKNPSMAHSFGNLSFKRARLTLAVGAAVADVARFMRLPKGARIIDFVETHDGVNTAATTANFGLKAVDGTGALDDVDYFLAAADLNAAGRNRWGQTNIYSVLLDEDYYVQAVLAGANVAGSAMDVEVTVFYEFTGNL